MRSLGLAAVLALCLSACDHFAILDYMLPPAPLSLEVGKTDLQLYEPVTIYPSGGYRPYQLAILAESITNPEGSLGWITDTQYGAGNAVGRVRLRVTDQAGAQAEVTVRVLPPAPESFNKEIPTPGQVRFSWSYPSSAYVTGFLIQRSADGQPYSDFKAIDDPTLREWEQGTGQAGDAFRIYALAGDIRSLPAYQP